MGNNASSGLADFEVKFIPDVRFGFTNDDIHSLYESWGEFGRSIYYRINLLDLLFIPCYTLLLGSLLARTSPLMNKIDLDITLISTVTAVCDLIETVSLRRAVNIYPMLMDEKVAQIASLAQQVKWIALSLNVFMVLVFGCRGFFTKKS